MFGLCLSRFLYTMSFKIIKPKILNPLPPDFLKKRNVSWPFPACFDIDGHRDLFYFFLIVV